MVVWEVISGIQSKDERVIYCWYIKAVQVQSNQEQKFNQQQTSLVKLQLRLQELHVCFTEHFQDNWICYLLRT